MRFTLASFFLLFILWGCSTHNPRSLIQKNDELFDLTTIPKNLQNRIWLERFTINIKLPTNKNFQQELLLQTELTNTHIKLAALSLEGLPLFQANWDSQTNKLEVEKQVINPLTNDIDVKKIIHDLQATHWPLNKLKQSLYKGYSVKESTINGVKIRQFFYQNKVIIAIRKKASQTNLEYFNAGYQINIFRIKDAQLKINVNKNESKLIH